MEIEKLSFVPCMLITFLAATLLQATMIWQLIVIAGVIGGILAKNFMTAALSGILGFLATWLLFFALLDLAAPSSFALAFSFFSIFFGIGIVLIVVLGLSSSSLGYFLRRIVEEARSTKKKKK